RDLIERAKREYAKYAGAAGSKSSWKREQREWRRRRRAARRAGWRPAATPPAPASYPARVFAGLTLPLLTLAGVGLFWVWLAVVFSLVTRHELLGRPLPEALPLWIAVLLVILVYQAVSWPLHAVRRWMYHVTAGPYGSPVAVLDGLVSAGVVVVTIWVAFRYLPEVREFLRALPDVFPSGPDSFPGH